MGAVPVLGGIWEVIFCRAGLVPSARRGPAGELAVGVPAGAARNGASRLSSSGTCPQIRSGIAARIASAVHGGLPPVRYPGYRPRPAGCPSRPPTPAMREGSSSRRSDLEPGLSRRRSEGWREASTDRSAAAHGWLFTSGLPDSQAGRRAGPLPRAAATVTSPVLRMAASLW
jgi:hypothetical protein